MAVATDDGHARLREPQLGADHVNNPLVFAVQVLQGDPELAAVGAHLLDLLGGDPIEDGQAAVGRGNAVVEGRLRKVRPPYRQPLVAKALEGLRRGNLVYQVKVDVEHGWAARLVDDEMPVPNLLEKRSWSAHSPLVYRKGRASS